MGYQKGCGMIPRHLCPSEPGRSLWDIKCLVPELGQTVSLPKLEPSKVGFAQTTNMSMGTGEADSWTSLRSPTGSHPSP